MKKLVLLLCLSLLAISCSDDDSQIIDPQNDNENAVQLRTDATYGEILTDVEGRTLYFFSLDHTGDSLLCVDACIDAWPVFYTENLTLDEGLNVTDFATITRADGTLQTTYKGWPLYYFVEDTTVGQTNGEGVNDVWFVAKPDYTLMYVNAQLIGRDVTGLETNLTDDYSPGNAFTFYITDDRGNTLYRFINDTNGQNNYTAPDFSNDALWPIYEQSLGAIPSILNASDFGTINVHGRTQITFKGWPLYYFQFDENRGDNFGVGFPQQGVWPIVNNDTPVADGADVMNDIRVLGTPNFGRILADSEGKALYFFSWDSQGLSDCNEGCIDAWPVFYVENPSLDEGLEVDDFGTITRDDGSLQTTYKGWPLYYFVNDTAPFEINGDGANDVWFVAKPDYSLMFISAQLVGQDVDGVETEYVEDQNLYTVGQGRSYYITDAYGNTLYRFFQDTNGQNNYTAEDFSNNELWPIYNVQVTNVPSILNASDFETIDVFGAPQLTYKGWPLYKFQFDNNRGDNFGVGFPQVGIWPIANQNTTIAP